MDCKEFEKSIPLFLENQLEKEQLKAFFNHMEQCPVCKEELSIQFLVFEGILHLEEGDSFDLQQELENKLTDTKNKIIFMERLHQMYEVFITAVCIVGCFFISKFLL